MTLFVVDEAPRTLFRAQDFIEQHAAENIRADDIAHAAAVTVRSVQLAFRQHLGTTPGSYLRSVRLERAHRDLLRADRGSGGTVAAIAARWQFASPSRFAAYYREAFGELPSETLGH